MREAILVCALSNVSRSINGSWPTPTATPTGEPTGTPTATPTATPTPGGGPVTDSFAASDDARVKQRNNPNSNYGSLSTLRVRSGASSRQIDSYLKFGVVGVGPVTNATRPDTDTLCPATKWSDQVLPGVD